MSRTLALVATLAVLIAAGWLIRFGPAGHLATTADSPAPIALDAAAHDHTDGAMIGHVPLGTAFEGVMSAAAYGQAVHGMALRSAKATGGGSGSGEQGESEPLAAIAGLFRPDWLDGATNAGAIHLPLGLRGAARGELDPGKPADPIDPGPSPQPSVTYWRDAMPIIRTECTGCHYRGGIGPFPLETYQDAVQSAELIKWAVETRIMPPMPADTATSWPIDDPRIMADADRATLVAWIAAGTPQGDPATAPDVRPPADPFGPPTQTLDIGADYTPGEGMLDDYRCFVIDPGFAADTELAMVDVEPTNRQMFHHGIIYLADARRAADARRLDAAEPGPGYTCFGGPGFGSDEWVAAEAVGAPLRPYPAGTAKVIPAGSLLVLQLHYNTNNGRGQDRSKVHIWRAATPVNRPPRDARMANPLFLIPAGQKSYSVTASMDVVKPGDTSRPGLRGKVVEGLLWRSWGHMHVLGSSFTMDLIRKDGSRMRILNIPHWRFNWQGAYDHIDPLVIHAGDRIDITCAWDNSAENQPVIQGKKADPRIVRWGESTFDEMCLAGVTVTD